MAGDYFKIIRGGLNSTFQDLGRKNLYHIGLPFSGAMDKRNYLIANKLINNNENDPVIEFAFQGPLLKYFGTTRDIVITGNVNFKIIKSISNGRMLNLFCVFNFFTVEVSNSKFIVKKIW